jgi:hypothetical protein
MNTAEIVLVITFGAAFAFALLYVAREAIKRPWVKASWSWHMSISILPAGKRDPAPTSAATPVSPPAEDPAAGVAASIKTGRQAA